MWRSRDGGKIWDTGGGGCGDCHDIWWDTNPSNAGHYIVTGDGGMGIYGSPLNPAGNTSVTLPIGQMYRVTVDQRSPYWVYASRQDDGSMRIASDRPVVPPNVPSYAPASAAGAATAGAGAPTAGRGGRGGRGAGGGRGGGPAAPSEEAMPSCESGYTYPEPNNHRFVWGTCYAAHVATFDEPSGLRRSVSPWMHTLDSDPVGLKYRCQWSPPLAIDWFDNSVYFGCQVIFRTRDRGQTWDVISPDLSTGDPSRIFFSGGVVGDNLGQFYGAVISAIAPSRTQQGVVWAGTNDGKVWISRDAGQKWVDLTKNVNMPPWGLVRRIDASHFDPGTAYMAVDYHLVDNRNPFLFKTSDYGQTWTRLDAGLPKGHPLDYTLSVAENPHRRGMIFAGTGHGFFYSRDDGKTWTQFKDKLPAAPVNWIEVPKNAAEVAVATYGRGLWILRDLWQLEQTDTLEPQAELQLYKPRPATFKTAGGAATFVFALKSAPASPVTVEVLGADGAVISKTDVRAQVGMNQTSWNLLYPVPEQPVLRIDSSRQPPHLGRGPVGGPRAAGDALGAGRTVLAAESRARQVHRSDDLQRPAVLAAVRGVAGRDAPLNRCRPRREHGAAAQHRHGDERSRGQDQSHRNHARPGRRPAPAARRQSSARRGACRYLQEDVRHRAALSLADRDAQRRQVVRRESTSCT